MSLMSQQILDVPYYTQPTSNTCQSTCLKMYGEYLAKRSMQSSIVQGMSINEIWEEINGSAERPSQIRNSYQNFVWWLKKYFAQYQFSIKETKNTPEAVNYVVQKIDEGFPVMVSTNHANSSGHIILVVGYRNKQEYLNSALEFICHDPYGKFNPQLGSDLYGGKRYTQGISLFQGGEVGPGKAVIYNYEGIQRIRSDKHSSGTFFLIAVSNS
jgi:hypothetical protein